MRAVKCIVIVLLALTVPAGAWAQSAESVRPQPCGQAPMILALAERILTERNRLNGFAVSRFGTDAAYLTLRYSPPETAPALDWLKAIEGNGQRPPRSLAQMKTAFAISRLGVRAGLEPGGGSELEEFASAGLSAYRAILLADDGVSFFDLVARVRRDSDLSGPFLRSYQRGLLPGLALLDQTDARKLAIAERAEAAGEVVAAAAILGSRADLQAYRALLARFPEDRMLHGVADLRTLASFGLTLAHQAAPAEDLTALSPEQRRERAMVYDVIRAGYFGQGIDLLSIALNQSGQTEALSAVARRNVAARLAGGIVPGYDVEAAWLFLYDAMIDTLGLSETQTVMSGFDVPREIRHFGGDVQKTLGWVVAKRAIAPYVTGEAASSRDRPDALGPDLDWPLWVDLATRLRSGGAAGLAAVPPGEAGIGIELLYLTGDLSGAVDLAAQKLEPLDALFVYHDFMVRLDRGCARYSVSPGQAFLMGGRLLYRFPTNGG